MPLPEVEGPGQVNEDRQPAVRCLHGTMQERRQMQAQNPQRVPILLPARGAAYPGPVSKTIR